MGIEEGRGDPAPTIAHKQNCRMKNPKLPNIVRAGTPIIQMSTRDIVNPPPQLIIHIIPNSYAYNDLDGIDY